MQWKNRYRILIVGMAGGLLFTGCGEAKRTKVSYDMGLLAIKEGGYEEAKEDFASALSEKDNKSSRILNKKAYYGMGVSAFYLGDYTEAEINFEEALSIEYLTEMDLEIRQYQIDVKCNLGKFEEALELVEIVRKEETKDFSLFWKEYALVLECRTEMEANELLNRGLEIKGHGNDYKYNRAKIYYYLGNTKMAEEGMQEALTEEITESYFFLGAICQEREEYEDAIEFYGLYLEGEGKKSGFVFNKMGYCYEMLGEEEKAFDVYKEGIAFAETGNLIQNIGSGEKYDFLRELRFNEITLLEKQLRFSEALKKCKEYVKDYPDDEIMKRELDFLKTR